MKASQIFKIGFFLVVLAAGVTVFLMNFQRPGDGLTDVATGHVAGDSAVTGNGAPDAGSGDRELTTTPPSQLAQAGVSEPQPEPRPAFSETDPEPAGSLTISGMVVDESGRGIEGVQVGAFSKSVFEAHRKTAAGRQGNAPSAITGIDGFYEIRGVVDGEYRLRTEPDDRYEAAEVSVRAGADTADLVLRERRPDIRIAGKVRSEDEPLDNVQVAAVGQAEAAESTDLDGSYEFALQLTAGKPSYTLQFTRDGYREKRSVLLAENLTGPGPIRVDVELEPVQALVEVTGAVRDKEGAPVPGETVRLYSEATRQRYTAVSDRDGEVFFPEVETSEDYLVSVRPADSYRDYAQHNVQISAAGADLQVILEPLDRGSITGQMVDVNGQPVPGFSLWLRNPEALNQPARLVTGDQQGFFQVDEIEAGSLVFETRGSPLVSISGIQLSAGEKKDIRLVLDWGTHQVAGLVMDDSGQPVSASELFVTSVRHDDGMRIHAVRRAVTDETGYFLVTQVGPGYHTIRVDAPGFRAAVVDHDVGGDSPEVIVRLERAYSHGM